MSSSASNSPQKAQLLDQLNELCAQNAGPDGLYLRLGGKELGLAPFQGLTELAQLYEDELAELEVRRESDEDWLPLFSHPQFQRRKPQLVPADNLKVSIEDQYFVLKGAVVHGPYSKEQLAEEVRGLKVLPTDLVSTQEDSGWHKLYNYEEFDRREYIQTKLPEAPVSDSAQPALKPDLETEAITGLAYLGNLKAGKGHEISKRSFGGDVTNPNRENPLASGEPFQYFWIALFFVSFAGIVMIALTWDSTKPKGQTRHVDQQTQNPFEQAVAQPKTLQGEPIERPTRRPQVARPAQQQLRPTNSPQSLTQSRGFRRAMQQEPTNDAQRGDEFYDDYAYDDGQGPIENDPVRSRASREMLTAEGEPYEVWAESVGRSPAQYEEEEAVYQDSYEEEPLDLFEGYE